MITVAVPAAAHTALAHTPTPPTIDLAQAEEMIEGMFAQVDANHDGVADAAEQAVVLQTVKVSGASEAALASIRRMFSKGAGPNGKVTLASFTKSRMTAFDQADANHDGKLDAAEEEAARTVAEKPKG